MRSSNLCSTDETRHHGKVVSDKDTSVYDPSLEHTDYLVEGIVGTV